MARLRDQDGKRPKATQGDPGEPIGSEITSLSDELRRGERKSPRRSDSKTDDNADSKAAGKTDSKSASKSDRPRPPPLPPPRSKSPPVKPEAKPRKPQPAFPRKNQPPTAAAFAARLPLSLGKRFDLVRNYLLAQQAVEEDIFFYGPETGWAIRFRQQGRPLCSLHIHDERPVGIVSLEPPAITAIDWKGLSPAGRTARKQAHGSPSQLWLDVDLEGTGAADFRTILRAKLATTR